MGKSAYDPVRHRTKEEIRTTLSHGIPSEIRDALISASYWEKDWQWAEQQLINFSEQQDDLILWAVATGFGFIAAFNGDIDEAIVGPILTRLRAHSNPSVAQAAEESEADIEHFVRRRRKVKNIDLAERLPETWSPPSGHFET
jgi:NH3-dependent NAD+ synthetase